MYKLSKQDIKRGLKFPKKLSKSLAEEIGIHIGDGSLGIYKYNKDVKYSYSISGGYDDEKYFLEFVIPLMYKLYNIYPTFYKSKKEKSISLHYRSKGTLHFKNSIGLQLGKKTDLSNQN